MVTFPLASGDECCAHPRSDREGDPAFWLGVCSLRGVTKSLGLMESNRVFGLMGEIVCEVIAVHGGSLLSRLRGGGCPSRSLPCSLGHRDIMPSRWQSYIRRLDDFPHLIGRDVVYVICTST
jgi:hypothetical protein